jgi:A/G-specific adenine glycosylase
VNNEIKIQQTLLSWYKASARILPWRMNQDPYRVWISEIMLQQTRVEAVINYYNRWMNELPTLSDLANVDDDKLYKLWQGLGYYTRAKNLKKAAGIIVEQYSGMIPTDVSTLLTLPGIGPYTAGAIASISFNQKVEAIDGNVMRVVSRIYGSTQNISTPSTTKIIKAYVHQMLPDLNVGEFNQSLMDLGATICLPNGKPLCQLCPIKEHCIAYQQQLTDVIPIKTPKNRRKIQPTTVFLVQINDSWLLRKRPNKGLLANLWEFPMVENHLSIEDVPVELLKLDIKASSITPLEDAKHVFTHIEWHMKSYLIQAELTDELKPNCVLAYPYEIQHVYSVPTAFSTHLMVILGEI